jgi:hypothetical protein
VDAPRTEPKDSTGLDRSFVRRRPGRVIGVEDAQIPVCPRRPGYDEVAPLIAGVQQQ